MTGGGGEGTPTMLQVLCSTSKNPLIKISPSVDVSEKVGTMLQMLKKCNDTINGKKWHKHTLQKTTYLITSTLELYLHSLTSHCIVLIIKLTLCNLRVTNTYMLTL